MIDAGADVILIGRNQTALEEVGSELGPKAHTLALDLLENRAVSAMLPKLLEFTGQLDVFHANAGGYVGGSIVEGDPDEWDRMLQLNVNAAFRSVHAVLPHFIKQRSGDIVFTSSLAGFSPVVWEPIYSASKFAVQGFCHATRRQLMEHDVRMGAVLPGPVSTPLLEDWSNEKR
ncbi:unnamed protein product, partial [Cyprideis torosa]